MNSRELLIRTLNFESPARIPRELWMLPWAEKNYPEEAEELRKRYPPDIIPVPGMYTVPQKAAAGRYDEGRYTDDWGCKFSNIMPGLIGVPSEPLIGSWEQLDDFSPPEGMLGLDTGKINDFCRSSGKFTYSAQWIRPFERYQFIRTTELAMVDFALEPPEMGTLIRKIHEHYRKEVEAWAKTGVDAIGIMDDWGMQKGMLVSPEFFRKYYLEQYREYSEIAHHYGKYLFMHSDGDISAIIPDLVSAGVDALNSQLFCMDIEELGRKFRGRITFWGEIDRQNILPNGTGDDIRNAVSRVFENLYSNGGVIGQCEFGPEAKPENIFRVFESWDNISTR